MISCDASFCTCSPKASCASATSVSWPIGDVPPSCRSAFNHSAQHTDRDPRTTPLARTISGTAPNAVDPWWSLKDSLLQKFNYALHRCSPPPHETTVSNSNPSRVSACTVPLRLAIQQLSSSSFLSTVFATLFRLSYLQISSAVLYHCLGNTPHPCLSPFNPHRARVRRNHERLPSDGLIERAQNSGPTIHAFPKRAYD